MYNLINNHRIELMGVAILMVLLYHMCCWLNYHTLLLNFSYGYAGVDIFFLLSGYGLCYSYQKNMLSKFYANRFKRILPLFVVSSMICVLVAEVGGG